MQTRRVGNSGLSVSMIGLGTLGWATQVDEYLALDQLKAFYDAGGTLVETSPIYGAGQAQALVGKTVESSRVRSHFVLASRAGCVLEGTERRIDVSRSGLISQLDATLTDLRTDYLDLWQLDRWDPQVPLDETVSALAYALQSGKVRHIGVSNLASWQTAFIYARLSQVAPGFTLTSNQNEYSLLNRKAEADLIPASQHMGIGVLACAGLGRGVLSGKYRGGVPADSRAAHGDWEGYVGAYLTAGHKLIVEALARAADGLGAPMSHVALTWLWSKPQVAAAIVGCRTVAQLKELLDATQLELPPPISTALDDVSQEA